MPTVAEIAAAAVGAVAGAIPDAVHDGSLSKPVKGAFDNATGAFGSTPDPQGSGRVIVETTRPIADIFPAYVVAPGEFLVFLEGFGVIPEEGWTLTFNDTDYTVKRSQDILGAGSTSYAVVV